MKNGITFLFILMYPLSIFAQKPFVLDSIINIPNASTGKAYCICLIRIDTSWLGHFSMTFIPQPTVTVQAEMCPADVYYALRKNASVSPLEKGEIVTIELPKYDIRLKKGKVYEGTSYWQKGTTSRESISYDPQYCLVVNHIEQSDTYTFCPFHVLKEPAKIIRHRRDSTLIEVLDSTSELLAKVTVPPQYKTIERVVEGSLPRMHIESDYNFEGKLSEWREILCNNSRIPTTTVKRIQHALNARGYAVKEDNIMGKATKKALARYQKDKGLPVGLLDKNTLKSLGLSDLW